MPIFLFSNVKQPKGKAGVKEQEKHFQSWSGGKDNMANTIRLYRANGI